MVTSIATFSDSTEGQRLNGQLNDDIITTNRSRRCVLQKMEPNFAEI